MDLGGPLLDLLVPAFRCFLSAAEYPEEGATRGFEIPGYVGDPLAANEANQALLDP